MIPIINILHWSRRKDVLFGVPFKRLHFMEFFSISEILPLDTKLVKED
jgi:hypothetical protein